jgi:hypothetical protein
MTDFTRSLVLIAPAADAEAARTFCAEAGYTVGLAVPLSADGSEPATHYASLAVITPSIEAALSTGAPASLAISVQDCATLSGSDHFAAALLEAGLQRVQSGEILI